MSSYPNIVWFLIDSIRTYPTDQDLRGKLPVMERFGQQSVEFTTCITTAPSTIMSVTAMMTGLPAYFLARNYDDFRFDNRFYHYLAGVLKQYGYSSYAFLRGLETREKLGSLLDSVPRKYWPSHLSHRVKWNNESLNEVLGSLLAAGIPQPAFLFFHYNPQTRSETKEVLADPEVSLRVEEAWQALQNAGFTHENTIYVMCSDHGFPDPSSGLTSDWELKHRLSHDLVLTDDNILIPLYIRYPGCVPKKIGVPISSLDIFPTLLDLAGIPDTDHVKNAIDGRSLLPLIDLGSGESYSRQYFRCDSRLMLQAGRATAIRSADYKYIRFHDELHILLAGEASSEGEVLIDLKNDPTEAKNLLLQKPVSHDLMQMLTLFRQEFDETEHRALEYQINYLLTRHKEGGRFAFEKKTAPHLLVVFEPDTAGYIDIGLHASLKIHSGAQVDVLTASEIPVHLVELVQHAATYDPVAISSSVAAVLNRRAVIYDGVMLFVQNPSAPIVEDLLSAIKVAKAAQELVIDCNFNTYNQQKFWHRRARVFFRRLRYVAEEPRLLLSQLKVVVKYLLRRFHMSRGTWEQWNDQDD